MKVVRSLERRLERLFEGVTGRVFSGRLHPAELAGRLAREADLARFEHPTGPATANVYTIAVNPRDVADRTAELTDELEREITAYVMEEGLRLEGPVRVVISPSHDVTPGAVVCHVEVVPGPPVPWARLTSDTGTVEIGRIRAVVGRQEDCDVLLPYEDISRQHALIWSQGGQVWVRDLDSSNGTTIDGVKIRGSHKTASGSVIAFASHRYRVAVL